MNRLNGQHRPSKWPTSSTVRQALGHSNGHSAIQTGTQPFGGGSVCRCISHGACEEFGACSIKSFTKMKTFSVLISVHVNLQFTVCGCRFTMGESRRRFALPLAIRVFERTEWFLLLKKSSVHSYGSYCVSHWGGLITNIAFCYIRSVTLTDRMGKIFKTEKATTTFGGSPRNKKFV